ncbi:MAG: DUF4361 domain-containing protein [Paludibacter sp.]|nr:DUF4361 domain-containing protein [Paludibacter sp.]
MKKVIYFIVILLIAFNYSCSDGLPEEQFEKLVLLTKNGWIDQDIDVSSTGVVEIPIATSISGTSTNKEDVVVNLDFDPDTLSEYNFEKYRKDSLLYYQSVPDGVFSFEKTVVDIAKNNDTGVTKLIVDLNKITDKYKDYVIPIQIKNTSKYVLADNIYTKALYHLQLKNDYSGTYSGTTTVFKTKGSAEINDEDQKVTTSVKTLYAISDSVCYFYAGMTDRNTSDRDKYIINITFHSNDSISMESTNSDLNFVLEKATKSISKMENSTDLRYEKVTTTLDMTYKFTDLSSNRLRSEGLVSMTQLVLK